VKDYKLTLIGNKIRLGMIDCIAVVERFENICYGYGLIFLSFFFNFSSLARKRKISFRMGLNGDKCYEEKEGENSMLRNESGARSLGKFKRTRLSRSTGSSGNNSQLTSFL